jgi:glutamate N-acetyltransferase/amino-acid N-acetyltransferase
MAKGAAMLSPNMATMLAVLTTDAAATPEQLKAALVYGVADSFNALDVDGCTSTNDTVLLLASGLAGPVDETALNDAVAKACASLAAQMCADAEGATKVVRMTVTGAASDAEALIGARYVSRSNLVKCSWYGCDPYWGRIASDLGSCGIDFDPSKFSVSYGGITVCRGAIDAEHDAAAVAAHMAARNLEIVADLGLGSGTATTIFRTRTSTKTWAPHERIARQKTRSISSVIFFGSSNGYCRSSYRGASVSSRVLGQDDCREVRRQCDD